MTRSLVLAPLLVSLLCSAVAWGQGLPTATPEDVGLSSARLAKVTEP